MSSSRHEHDRFASALDSIRQALEPGNAGPQAVVDILHDRFAHYSWVGLYLVDSDGLVLGPWKGPAATEHTRIPIGQGICGAAAASGSTEIVQDVNADPRYLACFASTRSEIVVPVHLDGSVIGEIDIDSDQPHAFDDADSAFLEQVAALLAPTLHTSPST